MNHDKVNGFFCIQCRDSKKGLELLKALFAAEWYIVKFMIKVATGHLGGKRRLVLWEDRQESGKIAFLIHSNWT